MLDNVISLKQVSEEYQIPLSTLYQYEKNKGFNFPKRIKLANMDRLPIFNQHEVEYWHKNVYLKYKEIRERYNKDENTILIDELLERISL